MTVDQHSRIDNGRDNTSLIHDLIENWMKLPDKIDICHQALAGQAKRIKGLVQEVEALKDRVQDSNQLNASVARQAQIIGEQQVCLNRASEQENALTERFFENNVIEPMVRQLLPVLDVIDEVLWTTDEVSHSSKHQNLLETVHRQLEEFLATYNIQSTRSMPGDRFNAWCMQPVDAVATADQEDIGRIVASHRRGYCREDHCLRHEQVVVYRYHETSSG